MNSECTSLPRLKVRYLVLFIIVSQTFSCYFIPPFYPLSLPSKGKYKGNLFEKKSPHSRYNPTLVFKITLPLHCSSRDHIFKNICPIRTVKFDRHNRIAQGHILAVEYMISPSTKNGRHYQAYHFLYSFYFCMAFYCFMCWPRTTLTEIARRDAVFVTFSHPF